MQYVQRCVSFGVCRARDFGNKTDGRGGRSRSLQEGCSPVEGPLHTGESSKVGITSVVKVFD